MRQIQSIQIYRGLAALAVVFHHLPQLSLVSGQIERMGGTFRHGAVGVDFFFVLSGFLITSIHKKDMGVPEKAPTYLLKRIVRIYPLVILACLFKIAFLLLSGNGGDEKLNSYLIFSSFLLLPLPSNGDYLIGLMWTLSHEMLFYVMFLIPIFFGRKVTAYCFTLWAIAIIGFNLTKNEDIHEAVAAGFLLRPCNIEFLMGCLIAFVPMPSNKKTVVALLAVALIWLSLAACVPSRIAQPDFNYGLLDLNQRLIWGGGFALLVFASVSAEELWKVRFPRFLQRLGDSSYSLYLFHSSALGIALIVCSKILPLEDGMVTFVIPVILVLSAVASGFLVHFLFEKPMLYRGRKLVVAFQEKSLSHDETDNRAV